MLWSVLTITSKMYVVLGCSLVLAISLVFVVCFLLPDGWTLCPREASDYDPRQDAFADECNLPAGHVEKYRSTIETDVTSHASSPKSCQNADKEDRINGDESMINTHRTSNASSTTVFSLDSGRPSSSSGIGSSSSVISEASPTSSRRTSLAPVPSDCEAAVSSEQDNSSNRTPQIHLTIQRSAGGQQKDPCGDEAKRQLTLIIENAAHLPRRTYVSTTDPTVIVRLERRSRSTGLVSAIIEAATQRASFRSLKENELLFLDASCPVAYHCRSPAFKHLVQLPELSETDRIQDCQLVLRVEDRDKLVGTSELCTCRIDLSEILDAMKESSSIQLTRHLEQPAGGRARDKGEVLLGLSFLPTSQRITVRITQFERLPKWPGASPERGQAIVRLFVLNESGRVVKKRKTAPRHYPPDGRIEFDEQFAIELDVERWRRSVVLVVLSRIVELHQRPDAAGSGRGRVPPVYEHVGHVALGRRVAGVPEMIHWNSGLQMPRRVISQWHHLH